MTISPQPPTTRELPEQSTLMSAEPPMAISGLWAIVEIAAARRDWSAPSLAGSIPLLLAGRRSVGTPAPIDGIPPRRGSATAKIEIETLKAPMIAPRRLARGVILPNNCRPLCKAGETRQGQDQIRVQTHTVEAEETYPKQQIADTAR